MPGYVKPALFLFLVVFVSGMIGGFMAADRGRKVAAWCLLCALLPPLLIVLYFSGPLREVEGMFRKCLKCGELIRWRAPVCKYCNCSQSEQGTQQL